MKSRTLKLFICFFISFVMLTSISTISEAKMNKLYKTKREYVALKTKKSDKFEHPYTITQEDLTTLLSQVKYVHSRFVNFNLSNSEPAFTNRQIQVLANYGSKALNQASDKEYVTFFFTTPSRKIRRYTKGNLFIYNNELHVIFDRLNEPGADNDPGKYQQGNDKWQVVDAGDNQYIQTNNYGSKQNNWLVLSLNTKKK